MRIAWYEETQYIGSSCLWTRIMRLADEYAMVGRKEEGGLEVNIRPQ